MTHKNVQSFEQAHEHKRKILLITVLTRFRPISTFILITNLSIPNNRMYNKVTHYLLMVMYARRCSHLAV